MDATFAVAKESLKEFRLVRDLNAMNDVEVTRLTKNDNKQNSSVYNNNQTTISRDKNLRIEHKSAGKIKKKTKAIYGYSSDNKSLRFSNLFNVRVNL